MELVRHLLANKPVGVVSIPPDATVLEAIRLMAQHETGSVLVMRGRILLGIVSERDYTRKVALKGRASATTSVADIMTSPVVTVGPDETVQRCMQVMTERRFRHLAVVENGQVTGVVSIGDLVKAMLELQKQEIAQLQQYISS
ncbi:MAG TPA: CBS domain-containing protein [Xanthomonadaceae bacterium]|jgi:CBS domain-containing protein|nr:CBS domain-containing protein [Xanthomonadaceae bacterium]